MVSKRVLEEGTTKKCEKGQASCATATVSPPVVPLKNIPEWLTGNPSLPRDTPLVPKGTVVDFEESMRAGLSGKA